MATFDRLFQYALNNGKTQIHPKGSTRRLVLELYDLEEAQREEERMNEYIDRCRAGEMGDEDWSDCADTCDWMAAMGGDDDAYRKMMQRPIKEKERKKPQGRCCLRITLVESNPLYTSYSGSYFWYNPEEKVIELHNRTEAKRGDLPGICEEELREILGKYYKELPPMRLKQ